MKKSYKPRAKFYVDKKGKLVHDAVIFMAMAAIIRMVGCWGLWNDRFFLITQIALPLLSAVLFMLCLRFGGERVLGLSCVPVLMGAAFFVIRALGFATTLNTVLSASAAVVCAIVYTLTVVGIIRTKWLLPPLFAICFVFHVAVVDVAALRDAENPVLFSVGMQELSVLCTLVSMFLTGLAVKRRKQLEEAGLPKIKDPVVIVPNKPKPSETEGKTAAETGPENTSAEGQSSAGSGQGAEKPADAPAAAEENIKPEKVEGETDSPETAQLNKPGADI